jgi:hypothetical protein
LKRYYLPYDFDLAGLVNSRYAYPDPSLPIRKVTQRMYRGFCTSHEEEILGVLTDIPGLPENDRKRSIDYLDQFFTRAGDKEKMLKSFERRCH